MALNKEASVADYFGAQVGDISLGRSLQLARLGVASIISIIGCFVWSIGLGEDTVVGTVVVGLACLPFIKNLQRFPEVEFQWNNTIC